MKMESREFVIAIEIVAPVSVENWNSAPVEEMIDKVALNVIGAILEHNPEYEVRRLKSMLFEAWA